MCLHLMLLCIHFDCELCKLLLDVQLADKAVVTTKSVSKSLAVWVCGFHILQHRSKSRLFVKKALEGETKRVSYQINLRGYGGYGNLHVLRTPKKGGMKVAMQPLPSRGPKMLWI